MEDLLNALVLITNFLLVPGITYGCQLALGALGVTLVFGILRFSNFAHGETMAFGAMLTIAVTALLQFLGISFGPLPTALLALPFAIAGTAALTLVTDRLVYKSFRDKKSPTVILLIASVGVMFIMNGFVRVLIGPQDRYFADGERWIFKVREFRNWSGLDEGLGLRTTQALTLVIAVVLVIALFWFLNRTRSGKAMRAYSDNEDLALLSGINPERVIRTTWIISAALATIAGVLYSLDKSFQPLTFMHLLLPIFAAAIVGGLGSPVGAIAGGFVVALSEVSLTYVWKKFVAYLVPESMEPSSLLQFLSTDYKFAISFVILVLVLLVRPTGLFRGKVV